MDSRFAHLRQRDTSVSMLRVKLSRRRSQSQKENRDRAVNTRRQLDKLPELDVSSLDASIAIGNMSIIKERTQNIAKPAKSIAVEERLKQLERWKERKALEKEKEKREKERKGIFKTGLYHPSDTICIVSLPVAPAAPKRAKETKVIPSQSTRVTRSMKQQQVPQPLKKQDPNTVAKKAQPTVERSTRTRVAPVKPAPAPITTKTKVSAVVPAVRALSTRSANRPPVTSVPVMKDKAADVRTTRSRAIVNPVAPPSGRDRNCKANVNDTTQTPVPKEPELKEPEETLHPPSPTPCSEEEEEEDMVVDQAPADSVPAVEPVEAPVSSFAPKGFVFQAPVGLSSFKFEPLTPRSAEAFLTPSPSFILPPAPVFNVEPQSEPREPSPSISPRRSPTRTSPSVAPPTSASPLESKHDVPYFRSEIANETDRLTTLSVHWESKVEDESIPEEMRDRMRTAVGQARLLMKERFKQFSGLVDDCELGRGEKITTCTDLQGFWDMVYYQVEDVNKKFDALKEAEGRGWVEEHKPPPRQRKVVKKPSAAPAKPTGNKAAAKSRLAAVKAAMKARQQAAEAEKATEDAGKSEDDPSLNSQGPPPQEEAQMPDTVVFDGGFFQVESPAKPPGSVRRSSRLSAAVLPQASPCSNYLTPRRLTRRSFALAQTPVQTVASPAQPILTPAHLRLTHDQTPAQAPKSQGGTPQPPQERKDTVNVSLCFSPVKEVHSDDTQPEGSTAQQEEPVSVPVLSLPSISVVEAKDEPAEAADVDFPVSPRCSLSPRKTPLVSQAPEPSSSLSFSLSPCASPSQPPIFPPAAVQGHVQAQESVCCTPDSSVVEEIPGLDFERYLQPSQRCSLSPRGAVAIETLSPMAVDVEMESPRSQSEDLLTQQEPAMPEVPSVLTTVSPQVQTAESALLLFTPDPKERIRQSVCPSDLMVFTPPSNV
ncbi:disks large-associated protein 5 isoform X1 [Seriola lalandi dorsalis]|uniref:Discs, large (Drosophila) homolog-associated protein 5 n=1 Tax=Seriola lalandi dorsalis TaxID=1841481 RepID=A0A3B4WKE7_SERLL|nr:disks large-associated protein 5 isoform X1 [Seriola lalandi dorsalis]XP_023285102.1 disks large-associated protein 5 isoform X1 [Seriola lalandi dorsalis]